MTPGNKYVAAAPSAFILKPIQLINDRFDRERYESRKTRDVDVEQGDN